MSQRSQHNDLRREILNETSQYFFNRAIYELACVTSIFLYHTTFPIHIFHSPVNPFCPADASGNPRVLELPPVPGLFSKDRSLLRPLQETVYSE